MRVLPLTLTVALALLLGACSVRINDLMSDDEQVLTTSSVAAPLPNPRGPRPELAAFRHQPVVEVIEQDAPHRLRGRGYLTNLKEEKLSVATRDVYTEGRLANFIMVRVPGRPRPLIAVRTTDDDGAEVQVYQLATSFPADRRALRLPPGLVGNSLMDD